MKLKRAESEMESQTSSLENAEQDRSENQEHIQRLQQKLTEAERALADSKAALASERRTWEADLPQKIEEERVKWREEIVQLQPFHPVGSRSPGGMHSRPESPVAVQKRGSPAGFDLLGLGIRRAPNSRSYSGDIGPTDHPLSRRPSGVPPTPIRQDSQTSLHINSNGNGSGSPSINHGNENDDGMFDSVVSPGGASERRNINDLVSTSTVGAGPSVQLVERLSAAVRRLESEKAMSKEELTRLSAQRDEARDEVTKLMTEIEEKRKLDQKVEELEAELKAMEEKLMGALEMLGEKTEKAEELTQDVADLKQLYKDLVEQSVK
jgi:TATA element modulatory factor